MALTDEEFRLKSDDALESTRHALAALADEAGFDVELSGDGVLNVFFDDSARARVVVSRYAPSRQMWVSARSKSYKLAWAPELAAFALDGETLPQLVERVTRSLIFPT